MTRDQLKQRITSHNRFLVFVGILLIPTAIFLWIMSFWVFHFAAVILLDMFGATQHAKIAAWAMMFLLAFEGVRYAAKELDLQEYSDTAYYNNFINDSESIRALTSYYGDPLAVAYLVSRFLFCAPTASVEALSSFRSRLPADELTLDNASTVLRELRSTRKWTPAASFKQFGGALMLLSKMRLIWVETREGEVFVRIPPGTD